MKRNIFLAALLVLALGAPATAQFKFAINFGKSAHAAARGAFEIVSQRVWVPGHHTVVHVPARYGWRHDHCGRRVRVVVQHASVQRVWRAGYWKHVSRRVWVRR